MTAFDQAWRVVKDDENVIATYREVPEDHPDGEYLWECPHCKEMNQEWSSNQSSASPFRYSSAVDIDCASCGESVGVEEP